MEHMIVVHKEKHPLFEYGYPYFADVIHDKVRIMDNEFKGNRYSIYSLNRFYSHKELDKTSTDDNVIYNRCITMKFLAKHKSHLILRGIYFMSADGEVQKDDAFYYIHDLTGYDNGKENGVCTQYDHQGNTFPSEQFAVEYLSRVIDGNEPNLYMQDLDSFGGGYFYIMNASDMLINKQEE